MSTVDSAYSEAVAYWRAKDEVLAAIRARISQDAPVADLRPASVGRVFAPVVDLAVTTIGGHDSWFPCGLSDGTTALERVLRRGTPMRLTEGEQEGCPGGPGENLLFFEVDSRDETAPKGAAIVPYDLRWSFGHNIVEDLLVTADAAVLADNQRLDAIRKDVLAIIASASPTARVDGSWP